MAEQRGHDIRRLNKSLHLLPGIGISRNVDEQRNVRHLSAQLIRSLQKLLVLAQHSAMIRRKDHHGVSQQIKLLDGLQQKPDPMIHATYLARVVGAHPELDVV